MQLALLHEAERHNYYRIEDAIDKAVAGIVRNYCSPDQQMWHQFPVITSTTDWSRSSAYPATMPYRDLRCSLPPGLKEHQVRFLAKVICREYFEWLYEEE
jgi:hypothetical protein